MRLCRFERETRTEVGFYLDTQIIPLQSAHNAYTESTGKTVTLPATDNLLDYLPPDGSAAPSTKQLFEWVNSHLPSITTLATEDVQLLVPIPRPNKLLLLAGNYAAHLEEGGDQAVERTETFPYVFMKPPTTTLRNPGAAVTLPSVSPAHIDYELELAVIIGRQAKGVSESEALNYVAGFTIVNDISDRRFHPNPNRRDRPRNSFFDWMHGKWHDGFCPSGPCVTAADTIADPQNLAMQLAVNGEKRQDASTALQIFPVAAVIEFIASFVTLEPGDIISTGTPSGVGNARGLFLQSGDKVTATIAEIGTLETSIVGS